MTPYDLSMAATHRRHELRLGAEHVRHQTRLSTIDTEFRRDVDAARFVEGSPIPPDDVMVNVSERSCGEQTVPFSELVKSGAFSDAELASAREQLGRRKIAFLEKPARWVKITGERR